MSERRVLNLRGGLQCGHDESDGGADEEHWKNEDEREDQRALRVLH